jgi:hypothetical protein
MICDLWKKWRITQLVFSLAPERMENSFLEHEEILRLIEEKQYDRTARRRVLDPQEKKRRL